MTKAELIIAIAEKAGLKPDQAKIVLDAFAACVGEALSKGEDVRLMGFGTFTAITKPARTARNPRTGQSVALPEQRAVKFRVGESLKQAVA